MPSPPTNTPPRIAHGGKAVYGARLGILMLEARFPRIPGDMGNGSTWPFPVLYKVGKGASPDRVVRQRAEGLLDSLILSTRASVALCPAMDAEMWEHQATQANVKTIVGYGYKVWGPVKGELASGKVGIGRLLEPDEIVRRVLKQP